MLRLLPALLFLAALAVAWVTWKEGRDAPDEDALHERFDGGTEEASATLVGDPSARAQARRASGVAAVSEVLVPALPRDLPAWGLTGRIELAGKAGGPVAGAIMSASLEGPEGALFEAKAATNEDGVYRIGPVVLPSVPRRLRRHLRFVMRSSDEARGRGGGYAHYGLPYLADLIRRGEGDPRWIHKDGKISEERLREGRLLTSGGHPVDGAWLDLGRDFGSFVFVPQSDNGHFSFVPPGDSPGTVDVRVIFRGAFVLDHLTTLDLAAKDETLEIRLPEEREASGRVVDGDRGPVRGIHLVLSPPGWRPNDERLHASCGISRSGSVSRFATRSAPDGTFAFPALAVGKTYDLWWPLDDERWVRHDHPVRADDRDLEVVVERHAFEVRLVETETRRTVYGPSRVTRLRAEEEDALLRLVFRPREAKPAEAGTIGRAGERFRIDAWAPGYAFTTLEWTMPETTGRHVAEVELAPLEPPPEVRLRCVDASKRPLGPVPLVFRRPIPGEGRGFELRPSPSPDGDVLVLRDLPPGSVDWATTPRLGHPAKGRWRFTLPAEGSVDVPNEGLVEQEIPCPQGGAVRLRLPRRDVEEKGSPGPIGRLFLVDAAGRIERPWWYAPEEDGAQWDLELVGDGRYRPDGRTFESSAVPPGPWTLVVEESPSWEGLRVPLRIEAGRITDVFPEWREKDPGR